jgi:hypothetical protein
MLSCNTIRAAGAAALVVAEVTSFLSYPQVSRPPDHRQGGRDTRT